MRTARSSRGSGPARGESRRSRSRRRPFPGTGRRRSGPPARAGGAPRERASAHLELLSQVFLEQALAGGDLPVDDRTPQSLCDLLAKRATPKWHRFELRDVSLRRVTNPTCNHSTLLTIEQERLYVAAVRPGQRLPLCRKRSLPGKVPYSASEGSARGSSHFRGRPRAGGGPLTRTQFIKRSMAAGLSLASIGSILAATAEAGGTRPPPRAPRQPDRHADLRQRRASDRKLLGPRGRLRPRRRAGRLARPRHPARQGPDRQDPLPARDEGHPSFEYAVSASRCGPESSSRTGRRSPQTT